MNHAVAATILDTVSVYRCQPVSAPLSATVRIPGSKSLTNRAFIAASLADGSTILSGILLADDTWLMIEALRSLGIAISVDDSECVAEITGCRGHLPVFDAKLHCGNSGTVMRFCTALATLGHGRFEMDGIERMRERPVGALVDALRAAGGRIEYLGAEGFPPIAVHAAGLTGGQVAFQSPQSSQFVSALLLAGPYARRDLFIEVTGDVPSEPYLRMTTSVMQQFGVAVIEQYEDTSAKFIVAAPQRYKGVNFSIEPDASNATYFLAAPAIVGGRVSVTGLGTTSMQGDARFVDVLEKMGCRIERSPTQLTVQGPPDGERLRGLDIDLNDMPDTVQTLAVLALFAEGTTTIRNVANLRVKETDRLSALCCELTKLGAEVSQWPDGLAIQPPKHLSPACIETYDDHRMAMSFALIGLRCSGLTINDPGCCAKTFPNFFSCLEAL